MKKADYVVSQKAVLAQAIEVRVAAVDAVQAALAAAESEDERNEQAKELKSAENRLKEAVKIDRYLDIERITDICYAHRIDFEPIMAERNVNTREFKLRMISVFDAITLNSVDSMRTVDDRFFSALASGRLKPLEVTLKKVQAVMQHQTTTQPRYMRDFLAYFGAIKKADDGSFSIDPNNAIVKKVCQLYG